MFETMKDSKFSLNDLEGRSYRDLQQLAKSLSLPSNVKKFYLIQLIHAKKFKTSSEVETIVEKVKLERKRTSQARKIMTRKKKVYVQAAEITSTCRPDSPPIANTPRRSDHLLQYDSKFNLIKYPQQSLLHVNDYKKTYPSPKQTNSSDRVLRSYNQRLHKQFMSAQKTVVNVLKTESSMMRAVASQALTTVPKQSKFSVLSHSGMCPKVNILAKSLLRNRRPQCLPDPLITFPKFGPRDLIVLQERKAPDPHAFANRPMIRSAYTTSSEPAKNVRYECTQSVGFRRRDGKISKINALVQKKLNNQNNYKNLEITMQDLIESNIDSQNMQYPNMSSVCPNPELYPNVGNKYYSNYPSIHGKTSAGSYMKASNTHIPRAHIQLPKPFHMQYQSSTVQYPNTSNMQRGKNYNNNNLHYPPIDQYPNLTSQEYPNIAFSDTEFVNPKPKNVYNEQIETNKYDNMGRCSVYYHKKIRGEQVRSQRTIGVEKDAMNDLNRLPRIAEVFSKFNDVHPSSDVTQPIFVQVSDESERIFSYPIYAPKPGGSTNLLESFYNFKNEFLVTQPLLQIATTNCTKCVYSTSVISSAMAQASTAVTGDACFNTSCQPDRQCSGVMDPQKAYDIDIIADSDIRTSLACREYEDYNTPSSQDTSGSQILDSTIPEMVEDAMEIISQDGDYMERIGMDVRMQCFLCTWAGPRFLLEYHIRQDHPNDIHKEDRCDWHITYTLGSLLGHQWLSRVIEHDSVLYALNAKYQNPDCIMVSLTTLSAELSPKIGSLTVYNRVSGEPYSWSGEITQLTLFDHLQPALKLAVSTLNLLPNSANLQLINGELVVKSPTKVVVGHPELNDIHIILFVKIFK